jgi:hypothetical protein
MSQRNPTNQRYVGDGPSGQTRKSAASFKPKTTAGASVRGSADPKDSKEAQKARKQAQRAKERERSSRAEVAMAAANKTPEMKKYRKYWWGTMVLALVCTAASLGMNYLFPEHPTYSLIVLGLAYAAIIATLVIDFKFLRPVRLEARRRAIGSGGKKEQRRQEQVLIEDETKRLARKAERAEKNPLRKIGLGFGAKGRSITDEPVAVQPGSSATDTTSSDKGASKE